MIGQRELSVMAWAGLTRSFWTYVKSVCASVFFTKKKVRRRRRKEERKKETRKKQKKKQRKNKKLRALRLLDFLFLKNVTSAAGPTDRQADRQAGWLTWQRDLQHLYLVPFRSMAPGCVASRRRTRGSAAGPSDL